jgi:hypothetical protein
LGEDVIGWGVVVYQVHEHGTACAVVSAERGTVCVPLALGLAYLVGAHLTMHGVNVRHEQGAVGRIDAGIYVQVAYSVEPHKLRVIAQMCRQGSLQPRCEELGSLRIACHVWAFDRQGTGKGEIQRGFFIEHGFSYG